MERQPHSFSSSVLADDVTWLTFWWRRAGNPQLSVGCNTDAERETCDAGKVRLSAVWRRSVTVVRSQAQLGPPDELFITGTIKCTQRSLVSNVLSTAVRLTCSTDIYPTLDSRRKPPSPNVCPPPNIKPFSRQTLSSAAVSLLNDTNNLTLNMIKTTKTVIHDCRKTQQHTPPALPGITRVDTPRGLGMTLTRRPLASDHIRRVVSDCSQALYALRHYGLTDAGNLGVKSKMCSL